MRDCRVPRVGRARWVDSREGLSGRTGRALRAPRGRWAGDEWHRLFGGVALVVRFWRVGLVVLGGMSDGSGGRGEFPHVRMRELV